MKTKYTRVTVNNVLGGELWESKFDGFFGLVQECIVDVWEVRKRKFKIVTQDLV